jgi:hypothetical protein
VETPGYQYLTYRRRNGGVTGLTASLGLGTSLRLVFGTIYTGLSQRKRGWE